MEFQLVALFDAKFDAKLEEKFELRAMKIGVLVHIYNNHNHP
jgi:hypothetical protein